jgi:hypothetical protein
MTKGQRLGQIANLTEAIAAGGDIPALALALKSRTDGGMNSLGESRR